MAIVSWTRPDVGQLPAQEPPVLARLESAVLALSKASEPVILTETLLTWLARLYPVQEVARIDLLDTQEAAEGERVIVLRVKESSPDDSFPATEFDWDRLPVLVDLDEALLRDVKAGSVHRVENSDSYCLYLPIFAGGKPVGMLKLCSATDLSSDQATLAFLIQVYANLHSNLDRGQRDNLTGLLNRQTFDSKISRMLEQQRSQVDSYRQEPDDRRGADAKKMPWLAIIDIDHFKRVNDEFGHLYGDEVILTISQQILHCFRRSDLLFRFGGEEFVVVLEPIAAGNVLTALERLRRQIEAHEFARVGQMTVSIGYAAFKESAYPPQVIDSADQALYYAKGHGRNQIANYEALVASGELQPQNLSDSDIDLF